MIWQAEREETLLAGGKNFYDCFGFVTAKFTAQADSPEDIALIEDAVKSCMDRIQLTLDAIEVRRKFKDDEATDRPQ